jgi:hypothetical protein
LHRLDIFGRNLKSHISSPSSYPYRRSLNHHKKLHIVDKPYEIAQRKERGILRFLNTPPEPRGKNPKSSPTKQKDRPASMGQAHKGEKGQ